MKDIDTSNWSAERLRVVDRKAVVSGQSQTKPTADQVRWKLCMQEINRIANFVSALATDAQDVKLAESQTALASSLEKRINSLDRILTEALQVRSEANPSISLDMIDNL